MRYAYKQYPKRKCHPALGSKIVQNADEEKALGDGWLDEPRDSTTTSQFFVFLELKVKPHWEGWVWTVAAVSVVLAVIGGIIKLSK
jgi:hypothetical protein